MAKSDFQNDLDDFSGGCAKMGCGLIAPPLLIMFLLMIFGLL